MKLMFLTDRIWGRSAYSKVLKSLSLRLCRDHDVSAVPMGLALKGIPFMSPLNIMGANVYGGGNDPFGEDVVYEYYDKLNADLLITIKEPWNFNTIPKLALNYVPMAIIDHTPLSPHLISRVDTAFKVIAVSRFGQRELKTNKIDSTYIPHGLEPHYECLWDKKDECAKTWYLDPDAFKIGIVAMNRARKMIPRMFRAIRVFIDANPDIKVQVMFWGSIRGVAMDTKPHGVGDTGASLIQEIVELDLAETIQWSDEATIAEGIPERLPTMGWDMVTLYNSFDVLLHTTGGEGFGLPLIEAQRCGVPVITTDYAAGPENVGIGLTVPYYDYVLVNSVGTRYALADIDATADALAKIANANKEKLARRGVRFTERYDWDNIMEKHMNPFLEECEAELYPFMSTTGLKKWRDA